MRICQIIGGMKPEKVKDDEEVVHCPNCGTPTKKNKAELVSCKLCDELFR